jgi:hypothetical protein
MTLAVAGAAEKKAIANATMLVVRALPMNIVSDLALFPAITSGERSDTATGPE